MLEIDLNLKKLFEVVSCNTTSNSQNDIHILTWFLLDNEDEVNII